jgi:WhiB family redox-sensing transcriptional regulator
MSITSNALLQRRQDAAGIDWRNYAACRDVDPDLFFPLGPVGASLPQIEQAKQVCRTCPVSKTCLRWALDNEDAGVWGGTTEEERRGYRQSRALGGSATRRIRVGFQRSHAISFLLAFHLCMHKIWSPA